ncbi:MAG: hypothetical protein R3E53_17640 [Myxococcota bacterium]
MEPETVERVVVVGATGEHVRYDDWIAAHSTHDPAIGAGPGGHLLPAYTSGTTGLPKVGAGA